jgi:hypothetical protein
MDMPLFAALEPWDEKETPRSQVVQRREIEKKP